MILHTIISEDDIFSTLNQRKYSYHVSDSIFFEVTKSQGGKKVNRVISTNPKDYLNYNIGQII